MTTQYAETQRDFHPPPGYIDVQDEWTAMFLLDVGPR